MKSDNNCNSIFVIIFLCVLNLHSLRSEIIQPNLNGTTWVSTKEGSLKNSFVYGMQGTLLHFDFDTLYMNYRFSSYEAKSCIDYDKGLIESDSLYFKFIESRDEDTLKIISIDSIARYTFVKLEDMKYEAVNSDKIDFINTVYELELLNSRYSMHNKYYFNSDKIFKNKNEDNLYSLSYTQKFKYKNEKLSKEYNKKSYWKLIYYYGKYVILYDVGGVEVTYIDILEEMNSGYRVNFYHGDQIESGYLKSKDLENEKFLDIVIGIKGNWRSAKLDFFDIEIGGIGAEVQVEPPNRFIEKWVIKTSDTSNISIDLKLMNGKYEFNMNDIKQNGEWNLTSDGEIINLKDFDFIYKEFELVDYNEDELVLLTKLSLAYMDSKEYIVNWPVKIFFSKIE